MKLDYLVGGFNHVFLFSIDELIFFKMVKTTNQIEIRWLIMFFFCGR